MSEKRTDFRCLESVPFQKRTDLDVWSQSLFRNELTPVSLKKRNCLQTSNIRGTFFKWTDYRSPHYGHPGTRIGKWSLDTHPLSAMEPFHPLFTPFPISRAIADIKIKFTIQPACLHCCIGARSMHVAVGLHGFTLTHHSFIHSLHACIIIASMQLTAACLNP